MKKNTMKIFDRATYFYIKNVKKWLLCPFCVNGRMTFNKETSLWICAECGKVISNPTEVLNTDFAKDCRAELKKNLEISGVIVGVFVSIGLFLHIASKSEGDSDYMDSSLAADDEDDIEDDEVFGLGDGNYPFCKVCGSQMTEFDGWAWYTCPECETRVRIIDGRETWHSEIFKDGKKRLLSDFQRADFCRGGDLSED